MRTLQPPLTTIERDLFQPSDALILRWTLGETLPPDVAESLAANTDACARRAELVDADAEPFDFNADQPPPTLPPDLSALIQRRVAARNAAFDPTPQAGQIVRIDALPDRQPELPRPLAVLLAAPSADASHWSGWLVAPETHYAGPWDALLGPDDEPCDPLARVIQTWNPVQIDPRTISRVLAQLRPARLAAVQALAADAARGRPPATAATPSLRVQSRQIDGHRLLTGTPLSGDDDPRHRYQQLYARAAQTYFAAPAAVPARLHPVQWLAEQLRNWASGCGLVLTTLTPLAQPMGEADSHESERYYQISDRARLRLRLEDNPALVRVQLEPLAQEIVQVEWREADEILLKATLEPGQPALELTVDPQRRSELVLSNHAGQVLLRMPLGADDGG